MGDRAACRRQGGTHVCFPPPVGCPTTGGVCFRSVREEDDSREAQRGASWPPWEHCWPNGYHWRLWGLLGESPAPRHRTPRVSTGYSAAETSSPVLGAGTKGTVVEATGLTPRAGWVPPPPRPTPSPPSSKPRMNTGLPSLRCWGRALPRASTAPKLPPTPQRRSLRSFPLRTAASQLSRHRKCCSMARALDPEGGRPESLNLLLILI